MKTRDFASTLLASVAFIALSGSPGGFAGGKVGAGDGIRTRDIDLGKVALYQLSYSRALETIHFALSGSRMSIGVQWNL